MTHSAEKELSSLPGPVVAVIWAKIETLAEDPRPRQARKLRGAEKAYRLRVGAYRVVYTVDDEQKTVVITIVRHRREAYR